MFGRNMKGASGFIIITSPDGPDVELETRRCSHCGSHWVHEPGSGRKRGYCMKCSGPTCGTKKCDECVPHEAEIELMEGILSGAPALRYLDSYRKTNG